MNDGKNISTAPPAPEREPLPAREEAPAAPPDFPAAGPHARRELTNKMATPGSGALPDPDEDGDSQTSTG